MANRSRVERVSIGEGRQDFRMGFDPFLDCGADACRDALGTRSSGRLATLTRAPDPKYEIAMPATPASGYVVLELELRARRRELDRMDIPRPALAMDQFHRDKAKIAARVLDHRL
jgi:hypothetical protein